MGDVDSGVQDRHADMVIVQIVQGLYQDFRDIFDVIVIHFVDEFGRLVFQIVSGNGAPGIFVYLEGAKRLDKCRQHHGSAVAGSTIARTTVTGSTIARAAVAGAPITAAAVTGRHGLDTGANLLIVLQLLDPQIAGQILALYGIGHHNYHGVHKRQVHYHRHPFGCPVGSILHSLGIGHVLVEHHDLFRHAIGIDRGNHESASEGQYRHRQYECSESLHCLTSIS